MKNNIKITRIKLKTPYQALAEKYAVHVNYVYNIANGQRKAVRGKALSIKEELFRLSQENN